MDSSKKVITIVTGNANKLKEINTILGESFPYEVRIYPRPTFSSQIHTIIVTMASHERV